MLRSLGNNFASTSRISRLFFIALTALAFSNALAENSECIPADAANNQLSQLGYQGFLSGISVFFHTVDAFESNKDESHRSTLLSLIDASGLLLDAEEVTNEMRIKRNMTDAEFSSRLKDDRILGYLMLKEHSAMHAEGDQIRTALSVLGILTTADGRGVITKRDFLVSKDEFHDGEKPSLASQLCIDKRLRNISKGQDAIAKLTELLKRPAAPKCSGVLLHYLCGSLRDILTSASKDGETLNLIGSVADNNGKAYENLYVFITTSRGQGRIILYDGSSAAVERFFWHDPFNVY